YGTDSSGTASPIIPDRPWRRLRATRLGWYPSSEMARSTRCRSSSETSGNSLTTFETVRGDTPARRATSPWVTGTLCPPKTGPFITNQIGPEQGIAPKHATWHATWQLTKPSSGRALRVAVIKLDLDRVLGPVDRRILGGFTEHLGRCIYGGVFDEGSPLSDADGFRTDV